MGPQQLHMCLLGSTDSVVALSEGQAVELGRCQLPTPDTRVSRHAATLAVEHGAATRGVGAGAERSSCSLTAVKTLYLQRQGVGAVQTVQAGASAQVGASV
jgi:hypothetical protein